ncbi:hypothetical protein V8B97DRAFT_1342380 [Scleroderma yunnanense]
MNTAYAYDKITSTDPRLIGPHQDCNHIHDLRPVFSKMCHCVYYVPILIIMTLTETNLAPRLVSCPCAVAVMCLVFCYGLQIPPWISPSIRGIRLTWRPKLFLLTMAGTTRHQYHVDFSQPMNFGVFKERERTRA